MISFCKSRQLISMQGICARIILNASCRICKQQAYSTAQESALYVFFIVINQRYSFILLLQFSYDNYFTQSLFFSTQQLCKIFVPLTVSVKLDMIRNFSSFLFFRSKKVIEKSSQKEKLRSYAMLHVSMFSFSQISLLHSQIRISMFQLY